MMMPAAMPQMPSAMSSMPMNGMMPMMNGMMPMMNGMMPMMGGMPMPMMGGMPMMPGMMPMMGGMPMMPMSAMSCRMTCEMTKEGMVCRMMPADAAQTDAMKACCEMMNGMMAMGMPCVMMCNGMPMMVCTR